MAAPKNLFTHQGVIFAFRIKGSNNADSFGHCSWGLLLILQGPASEVQKCKKRSKLTILPQTNKKTGSKNLPNLNPGNQTFECVDKQFLRTFLAFCNFSENIKQKETVNDQDQHPDDQPEDSFKPAVEDALPHDHSGSESGCLFHQPPAHRPKQRLS
jgi:hypothetical protein